jgi:arsenate reductase
MGLKIYTYKNCGTCKKAVKWLDAHGVAYREVPIRETPPSPTELRRMLKAVGGDLKRLFNTSGTDYKQLNMKELLPGMSEKEALGLLAANGNLVKRPFVLADDHAAVGFNEESWQSLFG